MPGNRWALTWRWSLKFQGYYALIQHPGQKPSVHEANVLSLIIHPIRHRWLKRYWYHSSKSYQRYFFHMKKNITVFSCLTQEYYRPFSWSFEIWFPFPERNRCGPNSTALQCRDDPWHRSEWTRVIPADIQKSDWKSVDSMSPAPAFKPTRTDTTLWS